MSANSKIEWTDHTFNPWIGCTKVSPGCANCYAESEDKRRAWTAEGWGKGKPRKRTSQANWGQPLKWNRQSKANYEDCANEGALVLQRCYHRPRVFCASLADWLDDEVPIEWLVDLLALIHATQNLDWLLLTKRPENFTKRVGAALVAGIQFETISLACRQWLADWLNGHASQNVWIGTSVEDQTRADERIPALLKISAKVRFLSCEPLLGSVDLRPYLRGRSCSQCGSAWTDDACGPTHAMLAADAGIHWVIVGGESGSGARACNVRWPLQIVAQCKPRGIAVLVKQLGKYVIDRNDAGFDEETGREWPMGTDTRDIDPDCYQGAPVRVLLRSSKGGDPAEWPEDLRIRQFPSTTSEVQS